MTDAWVCGMQYSSLRLPDGFGVGQWGFLHLKILCSSVLYFLEQLYVQNCISVNKLTVWNNLKISMSIPLFCQCYNIQLCSQTTFLRRDDEGLCPLIILDFISQDHKFPSLDLFIFAMRSPKCVSSFLLPLFPNAAFQGLSPRGLSYF